MDKNWHYVYLLANHKAPCIYIGCTNNLKKRLTEHKEGKVFSTKRMLPVELIYFEAYNSKEKAYNREKSLKKFGSGLSKLKLRIGIGNKGRAG
ncbi:GIY-YIG nuclease family protein [Candidatus Omnitrophota bacterium]